MGGIATAILEAEVIALSATRDRVVARAADKSELSVGFRRAVERKAVTAAETAGLDQKTRSGRDIAVIEGQIVAVTADEIQHLDIGDRIRVEDEACRIIAVEDHHIPAGSAVDLVGRIESRAQADDVVAIAGIDRVVT